MRAYTSYFKLKFISSLQYRTSAIAGICTQFFFGFVYIMVYIAFYESGGKNLPMKLEELITYIWLNQSFFALISQYYKDKELFALIRTGNISYELARPKNTYFLWYFKILGQRLANVTLRFIPVILVASLLPKPYNFLPPITIYNFLLFIISLILGTLLITSLSVLYPIITIKTLNEKGIVNILMVIGDILSGVIVPIPFLPKTLKIISSILPFQYTSDLPFRLYVGNISIDSVVKPLIMQIIWIIILIILGQIIMKNNMKRIEVQGG